MGCSAGLTFSGTAVPAWEGARAMDAGLDGGMTVGAREAAFASAAAAAETCEEGLPPNTTTEGITLFSFEMLGTPEAASCTVGALELGLTGTSSAGTAIEGTLVGTGEGSLPCAPLELFDADVADDPRLDVRALGPLGDGRREEDEELDEPPG